MQSVALFFGKLLNDTSTLMSPSGSNNHVCDLQMNKKCKLGLLVRKTHKSQNNWVFVLFFHFFVGDDGKRKTVEQLSCGYNQVKAAHPFDRIPLIFSQ